MKKSKIIIITFILIVILIVWGLIGSSQAAELRITCNLGIGKDGSALCWKWHTNTLGDIGNKLNELFGK